MAPVPVVSAYSGPMVPAALAGLHWAGLHWAGLRLAAEAAEVKPLATRSILVTLGIIVIAGGAVVLAGLGYFTDDSDR